MLLLLAAIVATRISFAAAGEVSAGGRTGTSDLPIEASGWELAWSDEFAYPDNQLDENWESQNGPSRHILCSRWRENAIVKGGVLKLQNRKESRAGQDWTSASVWTKRRFKYGYFECRYRYAEAKGTNNSFWLMTQGHDPKVGKRFEIDINEGHYPNEVNTNIHNWSDRITRADGSVTHPSASRAHSLGVEPAYSLPQEIPITTSRVRLTSNYHKHFHIREFRVFPPALSYPEPLGDFGAKRTSSDGPRSLAQRADVSIEVSGVFKETATARRAADGAVATSWISNREGRKWIEFAWRRPVTIGCFQFVNGWRLDDAWTGLIDDFAIEWDDNGTWREAVSLAETSSIDLGASYHTYGLLWTESELVFFHDGNEIRRVENEYCHSEAPIFLSEAIIPWAGPITDAIDGTSMKVDWVRYYAPSERAGLRGGK